MSVSYKSLKFVLCIQELDHFRYTLLIISLKHFPLSPYMCVKILSILYKIKK